MIIREKIEQFLESRKETLVELRELDKNIQDNIQELENTNSINLEDDNDYFLKNYYITAMSILHNSFKTSFIFRKKCFWFGMVH